MPLYLFLALATLKYVLNSICNIQRNFLWRGSEKKRKWALVGWDKLCKQKHAGGLNLRDPKLMGNSLGEKTWWKWLDTPTTPWAQL